ncbi:MAG: tetratricopeptide repeat protein [Bacteroidota bacterium]
MRYLLLSVFLSVSFSMLIAQADPPDVKSEPAYKKAFKAGEYEKAKSLIEAALERTPDDPELLYFMAYTLDRMNNYESKDPKLYHARTFGASAYLERLIELNPAYTGELYLLDPYEKLSAIWGSQAMHYLVYGQPDSANWCFQQGKACGGFLDPMIQLGKHILDSCEDQAVLLTSGDMMTFTIMYVQHYLEYRTDVLAFDINIVNTDWYIDYLQKTFDHPALDIVDLTSYPLNSGLDERTILIDQPACTDPAPFEWNFKAPYEGEQFLRSHLVLIDLIRKVHSTYPIRFTPGFPPSQTLGLTYDILYVDLAGRLGFCMDGSIEEASKLKQLKIAGLDDPTLQYSPGLISLLQFYRMAYLHQVDYYFTAGQVKKAKALFQEMQQRIPEETVPQVYESIGLITKDWEETFLE